MKKRIRQKPISKAGLCLVTFFWARLSIIKGRGKLLSLILNEVLIGLQLICRNYGK